MKGTIQEKRGIQFNFLAKLKRNKFILRFKLTIGIHINNSDRQRYISNCICN